jgi:hypothetical protein
MSGWAARWILAVVGAEEEVEMRAEEGQRRGSVADFPFLPFLHGRGEPDPGFFDGRDESGARAEVPVGLVDTRMNERRVDKECRWIRSIVVIVDGCICNGNNGMVEKACLLFLGVLSH